MTRYIIKRIGLALISLIVLVVLLFFLLQIIPGYPLLKGQSEPEAAYQLRLEQAGLLDSPIVQFFKFVGKFFTTGEFGMVYGSPISTYKTILLPINYSMMIALPAFFLTVIVAIFLGTVAAYYRGTILDSLINIFVVVFNAVPSFVLAIYFLEAAGFLNLPLSFVVPKDDLSNLGDVILSLIMPVMAMVLTGLTTLTIYTRNELVEIFKQDYIKTALSKGVSFRSVLFRHCLRNAGIPVLTVVGGILTWTISGSIIVEQFFAVPGAGSVLIDNLKLKQRYVVLFSAVFYAFVSFIAQIIIDCLYTVVDPRVVLAANNNASLIDKAKHLAKRKYNELGAY